MKTILLHPAYFPSIAQMSCVAQADKIVFEIQDNYQKQTYRNRINTAHSNGRLVLNVPIKHSKNGISQRYIDVNIEVLIELLHFSNIMKTIWNLFLRIQLKI